MTNEAGQRRELRALRPSLSGLFFVRDVSERPRVRPELWGQQTKP